MITLAGTPERLRPHLKTSKMPEVVRRYLAAGVRQFKCATLSEVQMALDAGATDLLLAHQPVGPNIAALDDLFQRFPKASLSTIVDCPAVIDHLQRANFVRPLTVYIDIDCGMHRTGIAAGPEAECLKQQLLNSDSLRFGGWHVYDGHLRQNSAAERKAAVDKCWRPFWQHHGDAEETVIAGGTPTFPQHAADPRVQCSPGTCVFWDAGYAQGLPDLQFGQAAHVFTRVISKRDDHLTLDLGHKAIAAENPIDRRVVLPELPDANFVSQSEEHLVIQTTLAEKFSVGDALLGIPWHICPTVALYDQAFVVGKDETISTWEIPARRRI